MRFASAGRRFSFGDGSAATGDAHAEQGSVEMEADRGRDRTDGRVHRADMASAGGVSDGDGLLSGNLVSILFLDLLSRVRLR